MKTLSGQQAPEVSDWDTATGAPISDIFSFQNVPPALAFSPDGALLAIASTDDVQVWGVLDGTNHWGSPRFCVYQVGQSFSLPRKS